MTLHIINLTLIMINDTEIYWGELAVKFANVVRVTFYQSNNHLVALAVY